MKPTSLAALAAAVLAAGCATDGGRSLYARRLDAYGPATGAASAASGEEASPAPAPVSSASAPSTRASRP